MKSASGIDRVDVRRPPPALAFTAPDLDQTDNGELGEEGVDLALSERDLIRDLRLGDGRAAVWIGVERENYEDGMLSVGQLLCGGPAQEIAVHPASIALAWRGAGFRFP